MSLKIGNHKLSLITISIVAIALTISSLLLPGFLAQPARATDPAVDNLGLLQMGTAVGGAHIQPCTGGSCGTGLAWSQIFNSAGGVVTLGANGVTASFVAENPNVADFTTFFTSSNKNSFPISTSDPCFIAATCPTSPLNWGTGNVPAKDDLTNVYEYAATNPANGHLIIYSGFERIAPNGDSHIDIEFYQSQVHLDRTPPCPSAPCSFVGQHTPGDVIVSMDFLIGGTLGSFSARKWNGASYDLLVNATGEGCSTTGSICAFNNGAAIAGGSWTSYDSHGNVITTLPANSFTNFGIDITALLGNTPCFSTTLGKTRTSGSFTAELKDFAGPSSFGICSVHIKIAPSATNEVGVRHTFTITFTENIGLTTQPVPDGTKVSVVLTNANGASFTNKVDNCATTGTVGGTCTVSFTSLTAGTVTGTATGTVTISGSPFTATTNGSSGNSAPAVKTFVDAFITIAPSAVNQVNALHTFTVTVMQNSGNGAGFVAAPAGTKPIVTLTPTNGASVQMVTNNCATIGTANGACTVTFTSPTGGIVTGTATVTFSISGVSVTRTTNGSGQNSPPAIKTFVDAFITIVPSAVNQVNQLHTFTITVKQNSGNGLGFVNAPDGTKPTVTLTPSNGATVTNLVNNCSLTGTVSGTCTVTFTSPTGGTVTGSASVTFSILGVSVTRSTNGVGQNSGTVVKTFVDAFITIGPSAVNQVNQFHTFTVTVKQNSGNGQGFVNAPDGTKVTVTLTPSNGATITSLTDNCATTGTLNGVCTVTFTSTTGGVVTGSASVTLTIAGISVSRTTNGSGQNSAPAVKTFVDAFITIVPSAVNQVNVPHTFTITVKQDSGNGQGFVNAPDGTKVTVTLTPSNGAAVTNLVDNCATIGTVNGVCTVTFTSATGGSVTANASVTLTLAGISVTRTTNGSGQNSGPATKTFVDAFITIAPSAVNQVNQFHTFTVTIKQDSGNGFGFVSVPDGTKPTVTLTPTNGATVTSLTDNCATTGTVNGVCTVTFTSPTGGVVTGSASVTLTIAGISVSRTTNGSGQNSAPAVKTFVDAFITIGPSATNQVNQFHTFTVTVQQNSGNGQGFVNVPDGTKPSVTLIASNGAQITSLTNNCATIGTVSGVCTVKFTSPTGGTVTGSASVTLTLAGISVSRTTNGVGQNSTPAVKTFVDAFITIVPSATNQVNQPHTFTITIKQDSGNGLGFVSAPDGTKVTVTLVASNGAAVTGLTDNCATTGTANGVCTVTFTSPTGGTVTGSASVTLTLAGISVTRMTDGSGQNSGPAVKTFVDAFITIAPSAVNQVNVPHTFTITVKQDSGNGLGFVNAPDGTKPTVTLTPTNGAQITSLTSNCATIGTVNGVCTVTFTSATGGVVTGSASVTLTLAGISVTRTTNGVGQNSAPAVKTFVDAFITIGPNGVNSVFVTHTFTVTVQQDSGNGQGFVSVPDGTKVTVTLTAILGATIMNTVDNCASTGTVSGVCTVSFTSSTAGNVTGTATVTLTIDTISVTRSTDGTAKNSGPALKRFVAGSLAWTKVDNVGNLLAGSTFQVCRVDNFITTPPGPSGTLVPITPVCFSVTDNQPPDQNPAGGAFLLTGLQLGNYTVQETIAPPGFVLDTRIATAVLTATSPSFTITPAFSNPRPILKLTSFGYTNTPTSTASQCPPTCTISGTTTYTVTVTNFGGADALLNANLTVYISTIPQGGSGSLTCPNNNCTFLLSNTLVKANGGVATFTFQVQYTCSAGVVISAALTSATYTTSPSNGLVRTVNGTPATISFTVQPN